MVGAVFDGFHESDDGSTDIYKQHTDLERNTQSSAGSPDCLFCSIVLETAVAFLLLNGPSRSGGTGGDSGTTAGETQAR